ncbi:MAG: glycosyltransferase family 4 protein [Sulfurimonas sp.]|nr:glycosyltransferase family 4 protein [Sulfurimonas sp.]
MIYLFLFFLSLSLTYLIRKIALKKSLLAHVTERSSHTTPTPHGGGIAIAFVWFIGISYLYFQGDMSIALYGALLSGILLSIVSYMDDLFELSPKLRLLTQASVASLALYFLGGLGKIDFIFFAIENQLATNIFAFFMIVWFINLYNFLDGIDGYAGSEAVFLALAAFILFGDAHFLVLISAVLGFLFWNWHKAKIFMGDVGSTLLGYNVAVFTIFYANEKSESFWIWIILFGLFWFDATLTLYRRYKNGEKLSQAHKKHGYQRLVQSGWRHDKVVLFSLGINSVLFALVYFISSLALAFTVSLGVLYLCTKYIDRKKGFA